MPLNTQNFIWVKCLQDILLGVYPMLTDELNYCRNKENILPTGTRKASVTCHMARSLNRRFLKLFHAPHQKMKVQVMKQLTLTVKEKETEGFPQAGGSLIPFILYSILFFFN